MMDATGAKNTIGLSKLQRQILAVLPNVVSARLWGRLPKDIHAALGHPKPTLSQRAALSRALNRLDARGLIELGYTGRCMSGNARLVVLPGERDWNG